MIYGFHRPEDPPEGALAMRDLLNYPDGHARCRYQCLVCKYSAELTLENTFQITMVMENHLSDVHDISGELELTEPPEFLPTVYDYITSHERQFYIEK